jgi:hypothetical protein
VCAVCSSDREDDDSMMRPAILVTALLLVGLAPQSLRLNAILTFSRKRTPAQVFALTKR